MSKVVAEVSQHSRESGRIHVHELHERLVNERTKLLGEKSQIEAKLSEIESKRLDKISEVYRRKLQKSQSIAATVEIQSEFNESRAKLIRDKSAIEERLHDIKRRMSSTNNVREDVKVLLRIESLLEQILDRLNKE